MSQRWRDESGREWIARLTIADAERMRLEGFDLLDPRAIGKVFADPFKVINLVVAVHRSQIEKAEMSTEDFVELAMATEQVAEAATCALEAALSDFFRRLRRPALAAVVDRAAEASKRAEAAAIEKVDSPKMRQAMDAEVSRALAKMEAEIDRAIAGPISGE